MRQPAEADDLLDRRRERQLGSCGTTARRRATAIRSSVRERPSGELDLATERRDDAAGDAQQRRLAGPVRTDERDPLARLDREADLAEDHRARRYAASTPAMRRIGAHSSYPARDRRRTIRKNGAPMTAVTTPTGMSPSSRAARSA